MTSRPSVDLPAAARLPRRETLLWIVLAVGGALALLWGWAWNVALNDYASEAGPPLNALLHWNLGLFLAGAPGYGASLILRAPFALPGSLAGANALLIFRLAAVPCVLALAAVGVWLARDLRRHGGHLLSAVTVIALCVANPISYRALGFGHPEEILGAALCTAAVLVAQRGRANLAGLLLGLAIANKQWALVAIGPVVLALPAQRWRALIVGAVIAGALDAPFLFFSSIPVKSGTSRLLASDTGTLFHPQQAFWFFGAHGRWLPAMAPWIPHGYRLPPAWLGGRAHMLIVWAALPLTVLAILRRSRREDALLLLALLLLVRCWLDPWNVVYYDLPMIVALAAWETSVAHRFPIWAALSTGATWIVFQYVPHHLSMDGQALSFLIPATLGLAALAAVLYRPGPARVTVRSWRPALSRVPAVPS